MQGDYRHWNDQQFKHAEIAADRFLRDNASQIVETLQAKMRFLQLLIRRLDQKDASLNHRLDCFARIAEVSHFMQQDAQGFFELASHPIVARLLQNLDEQSEE